MMKSRRKKPTDYPQFTFRVDKETKEELSQLIEEVTELYNRDIGPDEYMFRKNDIIVEAIKRGIREMKKKKKS